MADETEAVPQAPAVDPAILDAISQTQLATLSQQVLLSGGAGRAYQAVAASAAIAVQDATDMLRNISTVSTTAIGVAMAQMLEGDAGARETLAAAQATLDTAVRSYAAICEAAATALKGFPSA
jgi:hypothetical protein